MTAPLVYILAGQSNMVGRCSSDDLPNEFRDEKKECCRHEYNGVSFHLYCDNDCNFRASDTETPVIQQHEWKPLACQPAAPILGLGDSSFGPELAIAKSLAPRLVAKNNTKQVYFIKFAMGSTNLHSNWNPNNSKTSGKPQEIGYYQKFVAFVKQALAAIPLNDSCLISGMFWLQGESDSSKAKDANAYFENFSTFLDSLRRDLDACNFPIVVSPVVWHGKKVHVVNQALHRASEELLNVVCIDELNVEHRFGVVQGDDAGLCAGHLTADGILNVGRRMGEAMPLDDV